MNDFKGVQCVVGGFLIHIVLGTLYLWTNITSAVTSYIRTYNHSVTYNQTLAVYACGFACQGLFLLVGGAISQYYGVKICCSLGGYVIVLATFLSSFSTSLESIILTNGVLFGTGLGICYTAPIICSMKWMPKRKGFVTGIITAGFGSGALVFGLIAMRIVNPNSIEVQNDPNNLNSDNGYYPLNSSVVVNVPHMYRVLSLIYFIFITIGVYLLSEPPGSRTYSSSKTVDDANTSGLSKSSSSNKIQWLFNKSESNTSETIESQIELIEQKGKDPPSSFLSHNKAASYSMVSLNEHVDDEESDLQSIVSPKTEYESHPPGLSQDKSTEDTMENRSVEGLKSTSNEESLAPHTNQVSISILHQRGRSGTEAISYDAVECVCPSNPSEKDYKSLKVTSHALTNITSSVEVDNREMDPFTFIKYPLAWHIGSCMICTTVGAAYIFGTNKKFAQEKFHDERIITIVVAMSSICNAIGKAIWGTFADMFGVLNVLSFVAFVLSCLIVTYTLSASFGITGYIIWTFLIYSFAGGNFVLYVPLVAQIGGVQYSGTNYGIVFSMFSFFVALDILVLSRYELSYEIASKLMGVLTFLGFLNIGLFSWHYEQVIKNKVMIS